MAKHKRHNFRAVEKYQAQLRDAHRQFSAKRQLWEVLAEARRVILDEAAGVLTQSDYGEVKGYGRACWDASWDTLTWRLGHEDAAASRPARTPADAGGWDYSTGAPTFGGHFHPTGELATHWAKL
jgi:hypothetical protein